MSRYDTFWRRVLAAIVDSFLLSGVDWLRSTFDPKSASHLPSLIWSFISVVIPIAYSVAMHARFGQTVGKMLCGVMVMDFTENRRITFRQALLRDIGLIVLDGGFLTYQIVVRLVDRVGIALSVTGGLLGFASFIWFVVEVLTMLSDNKRRALHDKIAGTVVVRHASGLFSKPSEQTA